MASGTAVRPTWTSWRSLSSKGDSQRAGPSATPAPPDNRDMSNTPPPEVWLRGPIPGVIRAVAACRPRIAPVPRGVAGQRHGTHAGADLESSLWRSVHRISRAPRSRKPRSPLHVRARRTAHLRSTSLARGGGSARPVARHRHQAAGRVRCRPSSVRSSSCESRAKRRFSDARGVGRAQLPSTVLGLLFHAAEHTQRHVGQVVDDGQGRLAHDASDAEPEPGYYRIG